MTRRQYLLLHFTLTVLFSLVVNSLLALLWPAWPFWLGWASTLGVSLLCLPVERSH